MDAITRKLAVSPALGLGVAITIGLALGSGALTDLLPFGRPSSAPAPDPAATPSAAKSGPVARPPTSDLAAHLDSLDTLSTEI